MERADLVIANLTPFRGPSADAGTLVELGWFLGRGLPVFGYSNDPTMFGERSKRHVAAVPDRLPGIAVEGFDLPGAVETGGCAVMLPAASAFPAFDDLATFERCVAQAARRMIGDVGK